VDQGKAPVYDLGKLTVQKYLTDVFYYERFLHELGFDVDAIMSQIAAITTAERTAPHMKYRGHALKRSKAFFVDSLDLLPIYVYPGFQYQTALEEYRLISSCPIIYSLWGLMVNVFGHQFNHVILTDYADESDNIGWHNDKTATLDTTVPIVTLNCFQQRPLLLRENGATTTACEIPGAHGSVTILGHATNATHEHSIQPSKEKLQRRISIIFRRVKNLMLRATVEKKAAVTIKKRGTAPTVAPDAAAAPVEHKSTSYLQDTVYYGTWFKDLGYDVESITAEVAKIPMIDRNAVHMKYRGHAAHHSKCFFVDSLEQVPVFSYTGFQYETITAAYRLLSSCSIVYALWSEVCKRLNIAFNHITVMCYENEADYVNWHQDKNTTLDPAAPIVSLSFGSERTLSFRPYPSQKTDKATAAVTLAPGSMLCMGPKTNELNEHALLPEAAATGKRHVVILRKVKDDNRMTLAAIQKKVDATVSRRA
ncbi:Alpha-ketoglutarate-dependent repair dioxygenase AlkB, partial [uncultured virus]